MCLWFLTDLKHIFSPDVVFSLLRIYTRLKDTGTIIKNSYQTVVLSPFTGQTTFRYSVTPL